MSDQIPLARSSTITNTVSLNSQLFSPPNTQLIFYHTNSIDTVVFPSPDSFCGQWSNNNLYPIKSTTLHSCGILYHTWSLHWTWQLISLCTESVLSTDYYSLLWSSTLYTLKYFSTQIATSSATYIDYQLIHISILPVDYIYYPPLSSHGKYSNGEESHLLAKWV